MAQLVARLVRNEKVGGSNPPSSTTGRHSIRMSVFLYAWALLWRRWCSGRRRARPPARSPHASLKARSGRSRSPPVPSGPSGALHTGGACVAWTSPARPHHRPRAPQPGPASAHGTAAWPSGPSGAFHTGGACVAWTSPARPRRRPRHCSLALRALRRPPHWRRLCRLD